MLVYCNLSNENIYIQLQDIRNRQRIISKTNVQFLRKYQSCEIYVLQKVEKYLKKMCYHPLADLGLPDLDGGLPNLDQSESNNGEQETPIWEEIQNSTSLFNIGQVIVFSQVFEGVGSGISVDNIKPL